MRVLGIVGSPRREKGLSSRIVIEVLAGARAAGAETELLYLVDQQPQYCMHCGYPCFDKHNCAQDEAATLRSRQIEAADALVLAAPVYVWQPNGLTAAFLDKVRLSTGAWNRDAQHGKPALGIAVAGGTGTGVFTALQSLYAWFCLWKYRPLAPEPVSRFNLDRALACASARGQELAQSQRQPYEGTWDVMTTYDRLPLMHYGRVDEFRWLAEQIQQSMTSRPDGEQTRQQMTRLLEQGRAASAAGDDVQAAQRIIEAYRLGTAAW